MKMPASERAFQIFDCLFLFLLSLTFIIPFITVFSTSFIGEAELARRGSFILIPQNIDLSAYKVLLGANSIIYNAYVITIFVTVVGTALNLFFTCTLAYGLSKKDMPFRNALTLMVFITMLISGGLIPNFLLVKYLGLYNNVWALIVPGLVSAWNMILVRNFFMQIPESLEESAILDGATPVQILVKIIVPLSMPAIATIGLFYAVAHWNDWYDAFIYITSSQKLPVQNIMRNIVIGASISDLNSEGINDSVKPPTETIKSAVIIISTLPILCVYPFIQKYFVKGVMVGSVKG